MNDNRKISWYDVIRLFNSRYDEAFLRKNSDAYFDFSGEVVEGAKEKWKHLLALDAVLCYCARIVPQEKRQFDHHDILKSCVIVIRNKFVTMAKRPPGRVKITPLCYYSVNGFLNVPYRPDVSIPTVTEIDQDEDGNEQYRPRLSASVSDIKDQVDAIGIILNSNYPREIFDPSSFEPFKLMLINPNEGPVNEVHFPWFSFDVFSKYLEQFVPSEKYRPIRNRILKAFSDSPLLQGEKGLITLIVEYITKVLDDEMSQAQAQQHAQQQVIFQHQKQLFQGLPSNGAAPVANVVPSAPSVSSPPASMGTLLSAAMPVMASAVPPIAKNPITVIPPLPLSTLPPSVTALPRGGGGAAAPYSLPHPPAAKPRTLPVTYPVLPQSTFGNVYHDVAAFDDYNVGAHTYGDFSAPSMPGFESFGATANQFYPSTGMRSAAAPPAARGSAPSQYFSGVPAGNDAGKFKAFSPSEVRATTSAAAQWDDRQSVRERLYSQGPIPEVAGSSHATTAGLSKYAERLKVLEDLFKQTTGADHSLSAIAGMEMAQLVPRRYSNRTYQIQPDVKYGPWCYPGRVIAVYDNGIGPATSGAIVLAVSAYVNEHVPVRPGVRNGEEGKEEIPFENLTFVFSGVVPIVLSSEEEHSKFRRSDRNELLYCDERGFVGVWDRKTPGLRVFALGLRQATDYDEEGNPYPTNGVYGIKCLMLHQVECEGLRQENNALTNQLHSAQVAIQQLADLVKAQQATIDRQEGMFKRMGAQMSRLAKASGVVLEEGDVMEVEEEVRARATNVDDDNDSVSLKSEAEDDDEQEEQEEAPVLAKRRGRPPKVQPAPTAAAAPPPTVPAFTGMISRYDTDKLKARYLLSMAAAPPSNKGPMKAAAVEHDIIRFSASRAAEQAEKDRRAKKRKSY